MAISENLQHIKSNIPSNVLLVAVSKTKPNDLVLEAYDVGQKDFGENYVQELVDKHQTLPKDIHWHFIGHLQSNKVKYIAPFVYMIHSVDSIKLLKEINKQAEKENRMIDCLLQIYIAQEETKFGFDEVDCMALLQSHEFQALKYVRICGLMGMASNTANTDQVGKEFQSIKNLFDKVSQTTLVSEAFKYLSIGMSGDYELAIKHGSTLIRVGSSIFGERNYLK
jgi:pyridoxal phosphate enzyme (YggS family)